MASVFLANKIQAKENNPRVFISAPRELPRIPHVHVDDDSFSFLLVLVIFYYWPLLFQWDDLFDILSAGETPYLWLILSTLLLLINIAQ